jgi:hypothetical protein
MSKSPFVKNLDTVQSRLAEILQPLGFRHQGRTFNRITPAGLMHAVDLQMGRRSVQGKFAVNLGVLLPCVWLAECQNAVPEFVEAAHGTIRLRLTRSVAGAARWLSWVFGDQEWFDLKADATTLADTVADRLQRDGLPFFATFSDYPSVLAYYDSHGTFPFQNAGRATLEAAIVTHHLGDTVRARQLFDQAGATDVPGFREHVVLIANRLGYPLN